MAETKIAAGGSEITPGNATTLTTWITALATDNVDVVLLPAAQFTLIIQPKCTTNEADFSCILYGYFGGATWREIGRVDWSGYTTNNPVTNIYLLAPARIKIPPDVQRIAIGRTAGTGTWTAICTQAK